MGTMNGWLDSEEMGKPFSHCVRCKLPLLEIATPWLVNKDFFRGECTLEYAICQPCRDRVADDLSEESKESVRSFLEREIDWEKRTQALLLSYDPVERLDFCIACQMPREQMEGFGISALFDSDGKLVEGPLPLLICHRCVIRMTSSLSARSREVWRKFLADYFPGPPSDWNFPGLL